MQDQINLPESNLPAKKTNLFHDWWEEMYPRDFLLTFKNYFFNHKRFFDEVFSEQWDNKVKPMAFLFTAIGVSLIIGAISPWGLNLEDEKPLPKAWDQMISNMDGEDDEVFIAAFGMEEIIQIQDPDQKDLAINNRLREALELEPDEIVTARALQEFFIEHDLDLLAKRAEYVVLKNQVEHNQFLKDTEIGEIEQVVYLNLFVLWCMFYWLIAHRLFKKADRTSRETVFVFMYGLGMLVFFVYIPFIAISGALDDNFLMIGYLVILLIFLAVLFRIFTIFKHTHNTGFFRLMLVYIKTFFVAGLFGVLLFAGAFYLLGLFL